MNASEFARKCHEFYNQHQHALPVRRLLVYTGLCGLASEFSALDGGPEAEYYATLAKRFQQLVLRTLANFPLIVPPAMESVEAIMAGVSFCLLSRSYPWLLLTRVHRLALPSNSASRL